MSKISVTTIAGLTSGGDANTVKIESGDTLQVESNATVGGTLGVTGNTTMGGTAAITGNTTIGGTLVNTGLVTASAGVAIGGTGSANTIDDYEEGTWQGHLHSTSTGSGGVAYTADNTGYYVKVGALVHFQIHINNAPSGGSATNGVHLVGLPFTATYYASVNGWFYSGFSNLPTNYHHMLRTNNGATSIVFQRTDGNTGAEVQQQHFGGSMNIMVAGTYYTNA